MRAIAMFFWVFMCIVAYGLSATAETTLQKPKLPLVFVPGIFGSKLCKNGDKNQIVWGTVAAMASFPELRLRPQNDVSPKIEPCGEIDEFVIFGPLGQDVYKHFIAALTKSGYVRDRTLFVFSYDWRLSNIENAKRLLSELEIYVAKAKLPADVQFDVIGHSMGGFVASIAANSDRKRFARIITVATPYQGSAAIFASLEAGWGWWQRQLVSMNDVRRTALSFPSIYELLPRYRNCCALGQPGNRTILNMLDPDDLNRILWVRQDSIADLRRQLEIVSRVRTILEDPSPVSVVRLFGVQQRTPEQVYFSPAANADPDRLITKTLYSWLGDGTVMAYSALGNMSAGRLPGLIPHDRIMSDARVIEQLQQLLLFSPVPPEKIFGVPVATCTASDGARVELDGAAISARERLVSPGELVVVSLSLRTSTPNQSPEVLRRLQPRASLGGALDSLQELTFVPVGEVEFDKERTDSGVIDFFTARFEGTFSAPSVNGDATLEVSCGPKSTHPLITWNFKVAP